MNDATPKDRNTALIYGAVSAVIMVIVAFAPTWLNEDQRWAILAAVAPVVALIQAVATRFKTTDNGVVVARAEGTQAVAADASVYDNGIPLETVPSDANVQIQAGLLAGTIHPGVTRWGGLR